MRDYPPAMAQVVVRRSSILAAPAKRVWEFAITEAGLEHEFGPWMRMRMPLHLRGKSLAEVPLGEPLGRAWLLFGRVIPFDYDEITLAERGPGMRFLERSRLGSVRSWQHERTVREAEDGACELIDLLTAVPRAPVSALGLDPLVARVISAVFDHRHRRLSELWGER